MAAKSGADLRGLAELAAEIYARSLPDPDDSPDDGFDERSVRLETTFEGAGVLTGDLTPECAAVVTAVLDALSAPAGAEDTRTYGQRYHDALQEAMRRLVASDLLPERAGQPVKVVAHIALADLLLMDGSSALQEEWIASARAAWAAARAGASVAERRGGVAGQRRRPGGRLRRFGHPRGHRRRNPAALDDLVRLCVELDRLQHRHGRTSQDDADGVDTSDTGAGREGGSARARPARTPCGPGKRWSKPLSARL